MLVDKPGNRDGHGLDFRLLVRPTGSDKGEQAMKTKNDPLKEYKQKQAEIKKLLKQIEAGLEMHDRKAMAKGGHNWGHIGDLTSLAASLTDLKDQLHGTGEYEEVGKTW